MSCRKSPFFKTPFLSFKHCWYEPQHQAQCRAHKITRALISESMMLDSPQVERTVSYKYKRTQFVILAYAQRLSPSQHTSCIFLSHEMARSCTPQSGTAHNVVNSPNCHHWRNLQHSSTPTGRNRSRPTLAHVSASVRLK